MLLLGFSPPAESGTQGNTDRIRGVPLGRQVGVAQRQLRSGKSELGDVRARSQLAGVEQILVGTVIDLTADLAGI